MKSEFSEVLQEEEQRFLEYYDGEEEYEDILLLKRDLEFLSKIEKLHNPSVPKKRRKLSSSSISPPRQFNSFLSQLPKKEETACRSFSSDSFESCDDGELRSCHLALLTLRRQLGGDLQLGAFD